MMAKYRMKDIDLIAEQWYPDDPERSKRLYVVQYTTLTGVKMGRTHTLSGLTDVQPGDWVVLYPGGMRRVYRPDVFSALFEPAEC